MPMDEYSAANLAQWDERVDIHYRSDFYGVERFKAGETTLEPLEREEMGSVEGKSLLHLQCHFGMDTLSWAREGADVTGLDFSPLAIEAARKLSNESGVPGRFVESELYDAPEALDANFDVVYTGLGALCWLPDIRGWVQIVGHFLKPGGVFYILEGHPIMWALDDDTPEEPMHIRWPYFETDQPQNPEGWDDDETYSGTGEKMQNTRSYNWGHGLGEIVTALIDVGLKIEFLHEHKTCAWRAYPWMVKGDDDLWRVPNHPDRLPLMWSLRAVKEA
ncbi:MAG: class I SAM-dependent methyltransferase [Dehalococcoidia bacterium]|jgi:SAM-dependent methyltransferase|nr:class I SAM-dependent methyltransferase [Dehalococcoidia bacterium]